MPATGLQFKALLTPTVGHQCLLFFMVKMMELKYSLSGNDSLDSIIGVLFSPLVAIGG